MCGSSIFDYIHSQDHAEFAEHTGLTLSNGRPLASPGEENAGPVGTHNPDGEFRAPWDTGIFDRTNAAELVCLQPG